MRTGAVTTALALAAAEVRGASADAGSSAGAETGERVASAAGAADATGPAEPCEPTVGMELEAPRRLGDARSDGRRSDGTGTRCQREEGAQPAALVYELWSRRASATGARCQVGGRGRSCRRPAAMFAKGSAGPGQVGAAANGP